MEHEGNGDTNCIRCLKNNPVRIGNMTRRLKNKKTSKDHPNYSIIKIGQNTEKSPGNSSEVTSAKPDEKNSERLIAIEEFIKMRWGRLIILTRKNTDNTSINKTKITKNKNKKKSQEKHPSFTFQVTNKRNFTWEILDMAKKRKP